MHEGSGLRTRQNQGKPAQNSERERWFVLNYREAQTRSVKSKCVLASLDFGVCASRYPRALRSAKPALGHERSDPVLKHHLPGLGLCLSLHWMQPSLLFSVSLFFLPVRVSLKLRSLHIHPPRLCRFAVFLMQTNVLSSRRSLRCHPPRLSRIAVFSYKPTFSLEVRESARRTLPWPSSARAGYTRHLSDQHFVFMIPGAPGPKVWARTQHADGALIETKSAAQKLRFLTTNEPRVAAV